MQHSKTLRFTDTSVIVTEPGDAVLMAMVMQETESMRRRSAGTTVASDSAHGVNCFVLDLLCLSHDLYHKKHMYIGQKAMVF